MADAPGGWERHTAPAGTRRAEPLNLSSEPLAAFAEHGVGVLRNFLSAEEVDLLRGDYAREKRQNPNAFYGPAASATVQRLLRPRAEKLMRQCSEVTDGAWAPTSPVNYWSYLLRNTYVLHMHRYLHINSVCTYHIYIVRSRYFATPKSGGNSDFPFHMDHDSFLMHQCHRNYVNLYIYIVKPDPAKSGLSLIPWSAMQQHFPHLCADFEYSGAKHFAVDEEGMPFIRDDFHPGQSAVHRISVHFDEISQTPDMRPGDALLFRMDLFHQTQDTETERVALSLRMVDHELPVTRANFERMLSNPVLFQMLGPMRREKMAKIFREKEQLTVRS